MSGTMSIQEGLDILLDVALDIKNRDVADVHFTCVGGGPGLSGLRLMMKEMGLEDIGQLHWPSSGQRASRDTIHSRCLRESGQTMRDE